MLLLQSDPLVFAAHFQAYLHESLAFLFLVPPSVHRQAFGLS